MTELLQYCTLHNLVILIELTTWPVKAVTR